MKRRERKACEFTISKDYFSLFSFWFFVGWWCFRAAWPLLVRTKDSASKLRTVVLDATDFIWTLLVKQIVFLALHVYLNCQRQLSTGFAGFVFYSDLF